LYARFSAVVGEKSSISPTSPVLPAFCRALEFAGFYRAWAAGIAILEGRDHQPAFVYPSKVSEEKYLPPIHLLMPRKNQGHTPLVFLVLIRLVPSSVGFQHIQHLTRRRRV
jgi:hypothetical protein